MPPAATRRAPRSPRAPSGAAPFLLHIGAVPSERSVFALRRAAAAVAQVGLFGDCTKVLTDKLEGLAASGEVIDMEAAFCSLSLDIIGLSVFNYPFGSVTNESPVIKVPPLPKIKI